MTPRKIAGVLLGFAGVATMIGPALLSNIGTDGLAQLACITASLSYALAAVWARRFRRMGLSPMSVTTGQLTAGALMMLPLAFLVDQPWTQPFPPLTAVASITALALLCTAFGYVLYFRLIDHAGATNALLVTLLVLAVPIVDTTFVVVRRLKHGERVFEADQAHLHHRFLRRGFSQRRAALTIWGWCISLAAAAFATGVDAGGARGDFARPGARLLAAPDRLRPRSGTLDGQS